MDSSICWSKAVSESEELGSGISDPSSLWGGNCVVSVSESFEYGSVDVELGSVDVELLSESEIKENLGSEDVMLIWLGGVVAV